MHASCIWSEYGVATEHSCTQRKRYRTCMLLNLAAHNVSIRNVKVKVKTWMSQNVQCHKKFCNASVMCTLRFVTVYVMWRCTLCDVYVLELLRCMQLRFVTLRHVTFTLCCFTLCRTSRVLVRPSTLEDLQESKTSLESACPSVSILSWHFFTLINPIWIGDLGTDLKNRLFYNFVPDFDGFPTKISVLMLAFFFKAS